MRISVKTLSILSEDGDILAQLVYDQWWQEKHKDVFDNPNIRIYYNSVLDVFELFVQE